MQLESHATPQRESPQQRYANLHRAIERGLDSDELWKELADVSLTIGHGDEAVRCMRRIRNDATRFALGSRLQRLGLIAAADARTASGKGSAAAASGPGHGRSGDDYTLRDHAVDALQYLFHQHMPWLVLLTTLAFPLVVGVGGFLTAGGSPLLLTAIAALPGLCVVSLVGAMGRQVLLASAEGNGDVPPVPGFSELIAAAKTFLFDATLVLGSLILPSVLAMRFGAPATTALPGLMIGAFFVPMAWALRHLHGDLDALSPVTLVRAIARCGTSYIGIAAMFGALFLPAAGVAWLASGRAAVWVQIAIIGPLCVVPLFLGSRLLGTWLDQKRLVIGGSRRRVKPAAEAPKPAAAAATRQPRPTAKAPTPAPATAKAPAAAAGAVARRPRRPESLEQFRAPVAGQSQPRRAAARPPMPPTAPTPRTTSRSIEGRVPAARAPEASARAHATPPARAAQRSPAMTPTDRVVVSGAERARMGAAARRP